ncbi:MAG: ATP-grasp domain-containing protein [Pseudomonadota bacterium]
MKNVFVLGLDEFNVPELASVQRTESLEFHSLLDVDQVVRPRKGRLDFDEMRRKAEAQLDRFDGSIDGIAAHWDFPSSALAGVLRNSKGLPGPSNEAICRCEHKYWSRLEQKRVVPDLVPPFAAVDPFRDDPLEGVDIDYPFWIKPIKAHSSHLGFRIRNADELHGHLPEIREKIGLFGEPFEQYLRHVDLPEEMRHVDGHWCIAEGMISSGRQCTLEGYVHDGETTVYGVVDSVRSGRHHSSFSRYQYPSTIPLAVQQRMIQAADRVLSRFEYDGAPFNMEFYWDPKTDRIRLLEVNARISKSHCPIFRLVDGVSHHQVMVDLALGRKPDFPHRQGDFSVAGKFMVRVFTDGTVTRLPGKEHIDQVHALFPEARIHPLTTLGTQLRHLHYQDSYSFELADIFLGAGSQSELLEKYRRCLEILPFEVQPLEEALA